MTDELIYRKAALNACQQVADLRSAADDLIGTGYEYLCDGIRNAADLIEAQARELARLRGAKPLTAADLADALGCFWNATIGAAHERQDSAAFSMASVLVEGIAAVQNHLVEQAKGDSHE